MQISGHLRMTCDSEANLGHLLQSVGACRRTATCDVFLHTWDTLDAQTRTWHKPTVLAPRPSVACARRLARELDAVSYRVDAAPLPSPWTNMTWWTGTRGDSRISLGGILPPVLAQQRVNMQRRRHAAEHDVVVRMRPDLYRASVDALSDNAWSLISHASVTGALLSCQFSRWPGYKGGDMCFVSLAPATIDALYEAWVAAAGNVLDAMACAWKLRSSACLPTGACTTDVKACSTLGSVDPGQSMAVPENILAQAMQRVGLRSLSLGALLPFDSASLSRSSACAGSATERLHCQTKYVPCPIANVSRPQCARLCAVDDRCRDFLADSSQSCYLLGQRCSVSEFPNGVSAITGRRRVQGSEAKGAPKPAPYPAVPRLPLVALTNPMGPDRLDTQQLLLFGKRNGWSGWWWRLIGACEHPRSTSCSLWSVEDSLLPAPRCPVNCLLATRPSRHVLQVADAVLLPQHPGDTNLSSLGNRRSDQPTYCIESEAGTWRMPACRDFTRAVSTRPGAAMRFSWFSRYYLPSPLAETNAHDLLFPSEVRMKNRFQVAAPRSLVRRAWDRIRVMASRQPSQLAIISVWFRHCHVAEGPGRSSLLGRLSDAGLRYASYGRCGRNVQADDPVLGGGQAEWLPNKMRGMRRHPFVLVSENALRPGWVTEKIYQALAAGVVPVWLPPTPSEPGWEDAYLLPIVPPHSVVLASSFPNLEALVRFLDRAASSARLYDRFHRWRDNASHSILQRELEKAIEATPCRICQALHASSVRLPT